MGRHSFLSFELMDQNCWPLRKLMPINGGTFLYIHCESMAIHFHLMALFKELLMVINLR